MTDDEKKDVAFHTYIVRNDLYGLEYYIDHDCGLSTEAKDAITNIVLNVNKLVRLVKDDGL